MPIYEYECKNCNTRFEKLQSMTADPLTECENCGGGPIRRVLHPVGIIFKGSGWYINDSRKTPASDDTSGATSKSTSSESKSETSSDSPKKETKEAKPSTSAE